ncbi:hypothetical protein [Pontiella sulfatireligans]|uniref:D-ribose pyranase n=1 Tax=Pontiella sulfatireligans TaxID=2750658 RepID=A0A6C2UF16_9BACT|nr:hypothetical protein [Pontiella sulfatireligans]VGO18745.1 hypothetical protein SCARR_00798 [Pontiella sulfatireligans]
MKTTTWLGLLGCAALLTGCTAASNWEATMAERMPEYGHRNWLVVADSAYPKQSAPGIETIYTDAGQVEVLEKVLSAVDEAAHVQPVIMLDAELDSVTEAAAPGVTAYRKDLKKLFGNRPIKVMPHDEIIAKLDKGSKLFNVLLLKSDMVIPYTSVFIELDCGYWNAEKEAALRSAFGRE